jgi:hypothetical protein
MSDQSAAIQLTPPAAIAITIYNPQPNAAIVVAPISITIVQPPATAVAVAPDPLVSELRESTAQMQPIAAAPIVVVLGAAASGPQLIYSVQPQLVPAVNLGSPQQYRRDVLTVAEVGQTVFTLSATPVQPQLSELYVNGTKPTFSEDYSLDGPVLTWLSDIVLEPSDDMEISYFS